MSTVNATRGVGVLPETNWQMTSAADITDTVAVQLAAAVTGKRNYLTTLTFFTVKATVPSLVEVLSGSTVIWQGYMGAQIASTAGSQNVPHNFAQPLQSALGEALNFRVATTATQTRVSAAGFVGS